jgi:hypothetical protein
LSRSLSRHQRLPPRRRKIGRAVDLEFTPKAELTQRRRIHQYQGKKFFAALRREARGGKSVETIVLDRKARKAQGPEC